MRNITQLSPADINHILTDSPKSCYSEIADELDIPVNTITQVVRQHNHTRLRRYQ